jgi:pantothenate kinase
MKELSASLSEIIERARELTTGNRKILGITGAPGAGKSTVTKAIIEKLGPDLAAFAPMDGFHLSNSTLIAEGKRERKGAIDTFDGEGYVNLLNRLRAQNEEIVHAPDYYRIYEESIGSALPIKKSVPLVVTEGNYLLFSDGPWAKVKGLLDASWFIDIDQDLRIERLIKRHIEAGKTPEDAKVWSIGSDQKNAEAILAKKSQADLVITLVE